MLGFELTYTTDIDYYIGFIIQVRSIRRALLGSNRDIHIYMWIGAGVVYALGTLLSCRFKAINSNDPHGCLVLRIAVEFCAKRKL